MVPLLLQRKNLKKSVTAMRINSNLKNANSTIFSVLKNEDFTKIQQEIPKKLITDITNMSVLS